MKLNPELITKDSKWNYHFWHEAAKKEAEKQWFRLPTKEEISSPEFKADIMQRDTFPGYRYRDSIEFWSRGSYLYLWSSYQYWDNAYSLVFNEWDSGAYDIWDDRVYGFSVVCIKD